jgi:hypothetical protein
MMEAANTYETLVNIYQTTRRNNPYDSHLQANRCLAHGKKCHALLQSATLPQFCADHTTNSTAWSV